MLCSVFPKHKKETQISVKVTPNIDDMREANNWLTRLKIDTVKTFIYSL